eukprot:75623-Pyramimonas_sp.AAC.1
MYARMAALVHTPELEVMRTILEDSPWIWVGDGFVAAGEVCFSSPAHFPPYLYVVPAQLHAYRRLLSDLGVSATFEEASYVGVLARLQADAD